MRGMRGTEGQRGRGCIKMRRMRGRLGQRGRGCIKMRRMRGTEGQRGRGCIEMSGRGGSHQANARWEGRRPTNLTAWIAILLCCSFYILVSAAVVKGVEFEAGKSGFEKQKQHHKGEAANSNSDVQALLRVKGSLVDSGGVLDSWVVNGNSSRSSHSPPCYWTGVICRTQDSNSSASQPVVVSLILKNSRLAGTLSASIGLLAHLETLQLGSNLLTGEIPHQIGHLSKLRHLDLSSNSLSGSLPSSLGYLRRLEEAIFDDNALTGEIPSSVKNLARCIYFSVQGNKGIRGLIPAGLRKIPELNLQNTELRGPLPVEFYEHNANAFLYLNGLDFSGSKAPEFGRLRRLRGLYMKNTRLPRGSIPGSLAKAHSLEELDLSENRFVGEIPLWVSALPNLKVLLLAENELSGPLPKGLGQKSSLSVLDVAGNRFLSGMLPEGLCDGGSLESLNLSGNSFVGPFPSRLQNCSTLYLVDISSNFLSGDLPSGLGSSASNLSVLDLSHNSFKGSIPWDEFGSLRRLHLLDLSDNRLSGNISAQIGKLRRLKTLNLSFNELSGSLPPQLGNCTELQKLFLQGNLLDGTVPVEALSRLEQLVMVNLAENLLEGSVEPGMGSSRLSLLRTLNFSRNSLTGSIPSDLGSLRSLRILDLSRNRFSCTIPDSIRGLRSLQTLDLSFNDFWGTIPSSLLNLQSLENLNLSYNMLSGSVPPSHLPWPWSSFIGNKELCFSNCFEVSTTPEPTSESPNSGHSNSGKLSKGGLAGIIIGSVGALALTLGVIIALCMAFLCKGQLGRGDQSVRRKKTGVKPFLLPEIFKGFSYTDIMAATRNLSEENVVGRGGYGTVYRGALPNGLTCAVKQVVLEQESSRSSFQKQLGEVEVAGQSRHKNVVNLLGFCHKGDETLIVYEFMPNGSLGDALHKRGRGVPLDYSGQGASMTAGRTNKLNWRARFNVLCGAACALEYMHTECRPQILHRDLKSNNILLDDDLQARITDFGMAKMVDNAGVSIPNMAIVTGSAGYLAPEYYRNMRITDKSDVYSFGVVILETLTGMYPTERTSTVSSDAFSLVEYVVSTLRQEGVLEAILDTALQEEVIESQEVEEQMTLVLQIGLLSTVEDPLQRPSMREVVEMLDYSKGEHGKIRVPNLSILLQDLTTSPPTSPQQI